MKRRLLLVNDYGLPLGGSEIGLRTFQHALSNRGWDVRMFTSDAGAGALFADETCFGTTSRFRTLVSSFNPGSAIMLQRLLHRFRPDVVHVKDFLSQLSPSILPVLRGTPSVMHVAWYKAVCPTGTKMLPNGSRCTVSPGRVCRLGGCLPRRDYAPLMFQARLLRRWRAAFGIVVANSHATRKRLEEQGYRDVEVIYYGAPSCPLRPPLADPPTAVFAGRLVREKGVDVLLRAFATLVRDVPAVQLIIVGDGPERPELERLIGELGLHARVRLLGNVAHDQMIRVAAPAWVQVVPSRWDEPFGIIAAEAMMQGRAAIVTGTGGLAEIVADGACGFHTPPGDVPALAAALRRLLTDRELAERFGAAARLRALARFSEERYVDEFVSLYERLLQAQRPTGQNHG
jgi:glycosyltransferase involved in cell wall biosynthesis